MDKQVQATGVAGPIGLRLGLNSVNEPWGLVARPTNWWHDGTFPTAVLTAIANWQGVYPSLRFTQVPTWQQADLWIMSGTCPAGLLGCALLQQYSFDNTRAADYWHLGRIHLDPAAPQGWNKDGRVYAMNHELGHWIGLDEQYLESAPPCNFAAISVMNALSSTAPAPGSGNCVGVTSPTDWDTKQAKLYWKGTDDAGDFANLSNVVISNPNPFEVRLTWKDGSWGDSWHWRAFKFHDGTTWVPLPEPGPDPNAKWQADLLGFHFPYEPPVADRTMSKTFNVQQQGWPGPGLYFGYVAAYHHVCMCWTPAVSSVACVVDAVPGC